MDSRVKGVIEALAKQFDEAAAERKRTGAPFNSDTAAMAAGPESAGFLNLLVRALDARTVVEVGTSFGYTALWLGEAARDTGGRVIGMEALETKRDRATASLEEAGLGDVVEIRLGDAKEIVRAIDGPIDLAFVDAWKSDYRTTSTRCCPSSASAGSSSPTTSSTPKAPAPRRAPTRTTSAPTPTSAARS